MKNKGFTLIELVVVIVILGVLAIAATPKFVNLSSDARNAVLKGVEAQVKSALTLSNAKLTAAGLETNNYVISFVDTEISKWCKDCYFTYGYPAQNYYQTWSSLLTGVGTGTDFSQDIYASLTTGGISTIFSFTANFDQTNGQLTVDHCYIEYKDGTSTEEYSLEFVECR